MTIFKHHHTYIKLKHFYFSFKSFIFWWIFFFSHYRNVQQTNIVISFRKQTTDWWIINYSISSVCVKETFFKIFSSEKKEQRLSCIRSTYFTISCSGINRIPVIHNISLQMVNYNSTIINGTCNECLCTMLLNLTLIFSFNCF